MSRRYALYYKELCDLRWNGQIMLIVASVLIVNAGFLLAPHEIHDSFFVAFTMCMLTLLMQGNLMVEEHEQNTNRVLRQAGVKPLEMILIKAFITALLTVLHLLAFFLLNGYSWIQIFKTLILVSPVIGMFLGIGTLLGQASKNTVDVSLYAWPIILFYFLVESLVMNLEPTSGLWFVIIPNYHIHYGMLKLQAGELWGVYLLVPFLWCAVAVRMVWRITRV